MQLFFRPAKEMALILGIAVLPVLIFGYLAIERSMEESQKVVEELDQIIVANFVTQIQTYLARAQDVLEMLAELPIEDIDQEILRIVYENNRFRFMPMFESLTFVDGEGRVKNVYPLKKELIGLDYSGQPFFNFVLKERKIFFSQVKFSSVTEQPVIEIAVPILGKGSERKLLGIINGAIRLQALSGLVKEFGIERRTGEAFLIGQFGEIIAHPDYQLVKEQENVANIYPDLTTILKEIKEIKGSFRFRDSEGVEYLISFQTISPTNWRLILLQQIKKVLAIPLQLRQFLLISLLGTFLGAGMIGFGIASYIIKLRRTEQEKAREERLRELEELNATLEIRVRARTRELTELAESLDWQVKERTKELRERMEELERFQRLAVGRELKMIELKKEIKKLKKELEKYGGKE